MRVDNLTEIVKKYVGSSCTVSMVEAAVTKEMVLRIAFEYVIDHHSFDVQELLQVDVSQDFLTTGPAIEAQNFFESEIRTLKKEIEELRDYRAYFNLALRLAHGSPKP